MEEFDVGKKDLKVNKKDVINAYQNGNNKMKELLVSVFGKDAFKPAFDENIKTWDDVCNKLGIRNECISFKHSLKTMACIGASNKACALYELLMIQEAINDGINCDDDGYSYYPCFEFYPKEKMKEMKKRSREEKYDKPVMVVNSCNNIDMKGFGVYCVSAKKRKMDDNADCGLPISYKSKEAALHAAKYFFSEFAGYYGIDCYFSIYS